MNTARARSPSRPTPGGALRAALERPRYEVLPLNGITDDVLAHVPPAVKITVTASPKKGLEPTMRVVEALASRGYKAVPHVAARLIRDREHLAAVLLRLQAADVREVFVIAGDARQQAGEFADAAGLLSAMGEFRDRFGEIGTPGSAVSASAGRSCQSGSGYRGSWTTASSWEPRCESGWANQPDSCGPIAGGSGRSPVAAATCRPSSSTSSPRRSPIRPPGSGAYTCTPSTSSNAPSAGGGSSSSA